MTKEIRTVTASDELEGYLRQFNTGVPRHDYEIALMAHGETIGYAVTPEVYQDTVAQPAGAILDADYKIGRLFKAVMRLTGGAIEEGANINDIVDKLDGIVSTQLSRHTQDAAVVRQEHKEFQARINGDKITIDNLNQQVMALHGEVRQLRQRIAKADATICYMALAVGEEQMNRQREINMADDISLSDMAHLMEGR